MYTKKENGYYTVYQNAGGPEIGTADDNIIFQDGYAFRNLAKTDRLLPYEDWRFPAE